VTRLDLLVPEAEDAFGDWEDVLRRAGISRRRTPRRSVLTAAGVGALLVVLFASPAFGILLDLIGRTNVPFHGAAKAPTRVQRTFFDMSVAAPRGMGPQAIAAQTRRVGVIGGRALFVAPTRNGGFCWVVEHAMGGCGDRRHVGVSAAWGLGQHGGGPLFVQRVAGTVTAPSAQTLWVEYADGATQQIPFVWVSKPIDAGFFHFAIPAAHRTGGGRAVSVIARDAKGRVVGRSAMQDARPHPAPPPRHVPPPRIHPKPVPAPTAPLQRGSAGGVSVVVGANGIAEFTTSDPKLRASSWACFSFMRYHETSPLELSYAPQAHRTRIDLGGLKTPVDGCEVQTGRGHAWPDPHGYHAAVEIPFTARGRHWLADRAAARKLALFVRWSRRHPGTKPTGIHVAHGAGAAVYSVRSTTGKVFSVAMRGPRIVRENVSGIAGSLSAPG
jgi:hypothetical protein